MIWKSKDEKQALDLSKVAYWKYVSKDWAFINQQNGINDPDWTPIYEEQNILEIYFGGNVPITFYGENADEIYNMLISQKEVI